MRFNKILRTTASAAVVASAAFGVAGVANAQVTSVDEIIVTAQLREQSLQDVPIVITTLSQETLEGAGVRDIKDLQILTPGLTVTSTTSETITSARIRGVGTVGDNPGLESSVGVIIDGVYRPRNGVGFGDLGEMNRIEVLKGPQGTLFGKNTSAGVINIITEAPSFTPGFQAEITAGNYGAWGASASVTGPIAGDTVAGRLYVATRQRDGFYDVITAGGPRTETDDQNQDFWTARGQLLFLPSDTVSVRVIADYSSREEYCCTGVQIRTGVTGLFIDGLAAGGQGVAGPTAGYPALPFSRTAYANRATTQEIEDMGISVETNIDTDWMGGSTLTSITAYRSWDSVNGMDVDFTGADIFYRAPDGNYGFGIDTFSQELRLAGTTDRFDWLIGGFYASEELTRNDSFLFGAAFTPYLSLVASSGASAAALPCLTAAMDSFLFCQGFGPLPGGGYVPGPTYSAGQGFIDLYEQDSTSFALFTNNTFRLTEDFSITAGLRFTSEEKEMRTFQDNINGNGAVCTAVRANPAAPAALVTAACLNFTNPDFDGRSYTQNLDEEEWAGKLAAQYRFSPELMAYGSYARGYKAGGFNLDRSSRPDPTRPGNNIPIADTSYAPETVDSWEIGLKSTLLDRTLLLNATWFHQTFENFQLNTFGGIAFIVESIPEVTSTGVDADFFWFTPIEGLSLQGGVTYAQTEYGQFDMNDLSEPSRFPSLSLLPGSQMSFAPEWSASLAVGFDRSLGYGLRGGFNLSAKYTSEYNTGSDLLPWKMNDAMTVLNGRITIGAEDGRWALDVWGQNLTDEEYYQVAYNGPLQGTSFQPGVTAAGPYAGTHYDPALDSGTYNAFLGAPRTYGVTLRVSY
jgi:iron complex outermembrane receptor protein